MPHTKIKLVFTLLFCILCIYVSAMLLNGTLRHIHFDDRFEDMALASYISPAPVVMPHEYIQAIPWAGVALYTILSLFIVFLPSLYEEEKESFPSQTRNDHNDKK